MQTPERARMVRVLTYAGTLVAIEVLLLVVAYMAPAMSTLFKPVYWVVAALFVVPIWHAARIRAPGHDRRHADRRDGRKA